MNQQGRLKRRGLPYDASLANFNNPFTQKIIDVPRVTRFAQDGGIVVGGDIDRTAASSANFAEGSTSRLESQNEQILQELREIKERTGTNSSEIDRLRAQAARRDGLSSQ